MFVWGEAFMTGVPEVDIQHKLLVQVFNELEEDINQGRGGRTVGRVLVFLNYYAQWHFEREEKCMDKYRCPFAEMNKQAHAKFLAQFSLFYDQYRQGKVNNEMLRQVHAELGDWLVNHIMRIDARLGDTVRAGNAQKPPG
ncbi:hypothetical protein ANRL3_02539 [Anaerolineae bacterium]|nr:hypothetical protein ANRL3_02539 [Anaerolineae bacterium]